MDRPSLIMRLMREANSVGSSKLNPEVSREVSNISHTKSRTVLSPASSSERFFNSWMILFLEFNSIVFFDCIYVLVELSRIACAFMMRSMLEDQPYSPVTSTQGESMILLETITFSTLSPRTSLMSLQRPSNACFSSSNCFFSSSVSSISKPSFVQHLSFLPSNSLTCWVAYSSIGSVIKRTSNPFFLSFSMNGEFMSDDLESPVI
mmetsp:Transcript_48983/g.41372  ORF Transcript_48983/g.41372 Transcript_48983/m.41372 type:complete len:206 (-) Transcript_48983:1401-2018(-)